MTARCLGLDIGGTKIAVGLVELSGHQTAGRGAFQVSERRQISTADAGDGRCLLERVAALGEEVCAARRLDPGALAGVGVGLPGPVDPTTQRLYAATGLAGLIDYPITEFFAQRWNRPAPGWVRADNDANAAALAEATYGAGRGGRVVCYFTVSTGIGGGIVVDGQLFRGASGQAGEFGHMKLSQDGPACFCGDRGCLEAFASGPSIARRGRAAVAAGGGALRALFDRDPGLVTAERLAEAARMGDAVARQVWEAAMVDLGAGVATVMNLFNPDAVVIGGGVSRSADLLLPIVRREVAVRAMPMVARAARVECAVLGDDVGIVGAALLSHGAEA